MELFKLDIPGCKLNIELILFIFNTFLPFIIGLNSIYLCDFKNFMMLFYYRSTYRYRQIQQSIHFIKAITLFYCSIDKSQLKDGTFSKNNVAYIFLLIMIK